MKLQAIKIIIIMLKYISLICRNYGGNMNKYKRADTMKRVICLVLAIGMILTAFMSMLAYFM